MKTLKRKEYVDALIQNMLYIWRHIFDKFIHTDLDKEIDLHDFFVYESDIVCALLYIYSMETFVYSTVNSATRDHDKSKIKNLGPLARAL